MWAVGGGDGEVVDNVVLDGVDDAHFEKRFGFERRSEGRVGGIDDGSVRAIDELDVDEEVETGMEIGI